MTRAVIDATRSAKLAADDAAPASRSARWLALGLFCVLTGAVAVAAAFAVGGMTSGVLRSGGLASAAVKLLVMIAVVGSLGLYADRVVAAILRRDSQVDHGRS